MCSEAKNVLTEGDKLFLRSRTPANIGERRLVGPAGLEPATRPLWAVSSNHLSYRPPRRPVGRVGGGRNPPLLAALCAAAYDPPSDRRSLAASRDDLGNDISK